MAEKELAGEDTAEGTTLQNPDREYRVQSLKKELKRWLAILFNINEAGNGKTEANEKSNGVHS